MRRFISPSRRRSRFALAGGSLIALATLGAVLTLAGSSAAASPGAVGLGTAGNFAVLAGAAITDVPTSAITGDVGLSPGTSDGLTCAEVTGTIYAVDASGLPCFVPDPGVLTTATSDETTAYNDAAGRTPVTTVAGSKLDGLTLVAGVYQFGSAAGGNLTGTVTLSGSASDVWIFQATSDLVFASSSTVQLTGGAQACNVFWEVGTSATLGTGSNISGTILAGASITAATGATITGRLLAASAVTLDHNTIVRPACATSGGSSSSGGSTSAPSAPPRQPDRALYCAPDGQAYNLVIGEDKDPPYAALNLVPAYVDPVTGSVSCVFPSAAAPTTTTTAAATTTTITTTATVPPPAPVTTTAKPKPAPPAHKTKGVKAATHTVVAHVAPKPAKHPSGFTG